MLLGNGFAMAENEADDFSRAEKSQLQEQALNREDEAASRLSASSSPVQSDDSDQQQGLITQSPFTTLSPGACEVVNGLVAQFCQTNPDDVSCQYLQ